MLSSKQQKLKQQIESENNSLNQQLRQTLRQLHQQLQINTLQKQLNKKEFKPGTKKLKQISKLKQIQPQKSLATRFKTVQSQRQSDQQSQRQIEQQSQQQSQKQKQIESSKNEVINFVSKSSMPQILSGRVTRQRNQTKNQSKKTPFNRTTFVRDCDNVSSLLIGDSYVARIMNDPHPNIITISNTGMNLKYLPEREDDLHKILDDNNKNTKTTKMFYTVKQDQKSCSSYLIKTDTNTDVKKDLFRHLIGNANLKSIGLWLGNAHFQYVFYYDLLTKPILSEMVEGRINITPDQFRDEYKLFRDGFIAQAIKNYASYIQLISEVFQHRKIFIIKLNHSPVVPRRDMYMALKNETYNVQKIEEKLTYIFDLLSFDERKLIVKKFNFGLRKKLRELNLINIYILSLDKIIHTKRRGLVRKEFKYKIKDKVDKTERHIVDNKNSDIWKKITTTLLGIQIQYDLQRTIEFPINRKPKKSNNSNKSRKKTQLPPIRVPNNSNSISKVPNNSNSISKVPKNSNADLWERNVKLPPQPGKPSRRNPPREAKRNSKYGSTRK